MKIAALLYGLTYGPRHRDFNRTSARIKRSFIECWGAEHEVQVFLSAGPDVQDVLDVYKPVEHVKGLGWNTPFRVKVRLGLEMLLKHEFDVVVATRLDMILFRKVNEINFDYGKFNFLFKEEEHWNPDPADLKGKWTCDNLHVFPQKHVHPFINAINDMNAKFTEFGAMHELYEFLVKYMPAEEITFPDPTPQRSSPGFNQYYLLDRYQVTPGDIGYLTVEEFQIDRFFNKNQHIYKGPI